MMLLGGNSGLGKLSPSDLGQKAETILFSFSHVPSLPSSQSFFVSISCHSPPLVFLCAYVRGNYLSWSRISQSQSCNLTGWAQFGHLRAVRRTTKKLRLLISSSPSNKLLILKAWSLSFFVAFLILQYNALCPLPCQGPS